MTRLERIPQEINQIDNEKLQLEQRLGAFWEHMSPFNPRKAYASSPESNTPSGKKEEGAARKTARAHCEPSVPGEKVYVRRLFLSIRLKEVAK